MRRSTFPGLFVSDEKRGRRGLSDPVMTRFSGFWYTPPATSSPTYRHPVRRQQTQLLLSNYVPSIPAASSFATPANILSSSSSSLSSSSSSSLPSSLSAPDSFDFTTLPASTIFPTPLRSLVKCLCILELLLISRQVKAKSLKLFIKDI